MAPQGWEPLLMRFQHLTQEDTDRPGEASEVQEEVVDEVAVAVEGRGNEVDIKRTRAVRLFRSRWSWPQISSSRLLQKNGTSQGSFTGRLCLALDQVLRISNLVSKLT